MRSFLGLATASAFGFANEYPAGSGGSADDPGDSLDCDCDCFGSLNEYPAGRGGSPASLVLLLDWLSCGTVHPLPVDHFDFDLVPFGVYYGVLVGATTASTSAITTNPSG